MSAQSTIESVTFGVQSDEQRLRQSKALVQSSDLFSGQNPVVGGMYDARMGTTDMRYRCSTCGHGRMKCPGHPGHIELPFSIILPYAVDEVRRYLRVLCLNCSRVMGGVLENDRVARASGMNKLEYAARIDKGDKRAICPHCKAVHPKIIKDKTDNYSFSVEYLDTEGKPKVTPLYPFQIDRIFQRVSDETVMKLGRNPETSHPKLLLMKILQVPPVSIRPAVRMSGPGGHGASFHDITGILRYIVNSSEKIKNKFPKYPDTPVGENVPKDLAGAIEDLQQLAFDMMQGSSPTSTKQNGNRRRTVIGSRAPESIARRIKGKQGRLRKNLLGRRVWAIGRNTISGDSSLDLNEVGISEAFARSLQVEEVVTPENVGRLTRFFLNGRKQYPGASRVLRAATKNMHDVEGLKRNMRLEPGDVLFRDTITGDLALFNRQPSLERSSMNVHTVKVLRDVHEGSALPTPPKRKTIAFNVSVTPLYNADFDGDEMNLVVLPNSATQAEGLVLGKISYALVSTKSSAPVVGTVQDSTTGGLHISKAEPMSRLEAMELFEVPVAGSGSLDPPDFSNTPHDDKKGVIDGRGCISKLLEKYPVSIERRTKWFSPEAETYVEFNKDETTVKIDHGKFITGVLDKSTIGSGSRGGIFHKISRAYGPDTAMQVIFAMQQMTISNMNARGFSTSISDMVISKENMAKVREIVAEMIKKSNLNNDKLIRGEIVPPLGLTTHEFYERMQLEALKMPDNILGPILSNMDPKTNALMQMVMTGGKGNLKNILNICGAAGQVTLYSSRVTGSDGRTLAYFPRGDMSPESAGFIKHCYAEGMTAPEHFISSMNGRNDLTNKALSTARTGFANRKAIMALQSVTVGALRDVEAGRIIQLLYGEDGIDPRQVEQITYKPLNLSSGEIVKRYTIPDLKAKWHKEEVQRLVKDRDDYRSVLMNMNDTTFSFTITDKISLPVNVYDITKEIFLSDVEPTDAELEKMYNMVQEFADLFAYLMLNSRMRKMRKNLPPHMVAATNNMGRIVRIELCSKVLKERCATVPQLVAVFDAISLRYQRSLMDPGSAVGIHAAQAVSEVFTQYMLDSHHRSVEGGTNKSGIERPEEIMGARAVSKEKTSEMMLRGMVPVMKEGKTEYVQTNDKAQLQELADSLKLLTLNQLVTDYDMLYERIPEMSELEAEEPTPETYDDFYPPFAGTKPRTSEHDNSKTMEGDWGWMRESIENDIFIDSKKMSENLTSWCCRIVIDRMMLVTKSITLETVIIRIRNMIPGCLILHTAEQNTSLDQKAPSSIVLRLWLGAQSFSGTKKSEEHVATTIIENIMTKPLRGVPGILDAVVESKRSYRVVESSDKNENGKLVVDKDTYVIRTTGTNIHEVALHSRVDPSTIISSSIGDTIKMFGIEAGRARIINEIKRVMGGKAPNMRHLLIYADQMTVTGRHTPFEGSGNAAREVNNILGRACSHNPVSTLVKGAFGCTTNLNYGLAASFLLGDIPKFGSGSVNLVVDSEFVAKNVKSTSQTLDEL